MKVLWILNVEHGRHSSKLTKIVVERIIVETQKLSMRMLENKPSSKEFKFPSMLKLFESKNNMVDCNLFHEDYDDYNAAKTLI